MNDEQKLFDNITQSLVDSRIGSNLSSAQRVALWREIADLAQAVAKTPLSPVAEPASYLRAMAEYALETFQ